MTQRYKRPESVLVVIHTPDRQVLMLRRREPADFWQSVTGSLAWDETALEAARRELVEETGFAPEDLVDTGRVNRFPIIPPWRARYAPEASENVEHLFTLRLPHPTAPRLNPGEHLEWRWLSWTDAAALASSWTNRDAILALGEGDHA
ncbi:MAG: dihydroneopterin triphosphate diphosphatase [Gammaproteobacteria bacterium]|jgi:dihydroneopterin triphosphate diphosphatase